MSLIKFTLYTALICVIAFMAGFISAHQQSLSECGLSTNTDEYCFKVNDECSTDQECFDKYGCSGDYADAGSCEVPQ